MNTLRPSTTRARVISRGVRREIPARRDGAPRPLSRRTMPWWLWPHVCSLDAPLVAVTWQRWWAHAARVDLPWPRAVILALAVWMIYLADRLVDASRAPSCDQETARHIFSGQSRPAIARLLGPVLVTLCIVTPWWLPTKEFAAGLGLLTLAGGYFWLTHRDGGHPSWTAILPKEVVVGGLFALGSTGFVLCRAESIPGTLLAGIGCWAVLCFLNCALISRWEGCARDRRDPASLLNAFPKLLRSLPAGCLGLAAGTAGLALVNRTGLFLPVSAAALLLGWLDHRRAFLSADALRVLADLVLLTPWCFLWFIS